MNAVGYGKWEKLGGLAMIGEVIANTNVIRYLMAAMGILGSDCKTCKSGNAESVDPGSRNNVQEYTPTDKACESKI